MTTEEHIQQIIERTQIADLLTRYFAAVDDKRIDIIVKATFTSDAKIIRPDGSEMAGQENILNGHRKVFPGLRRRTT
jgi:hypothetical protein